MYFHSLTFKIMNVGRPVSSVGWSVLLIIKLGIFRMLRESINSHRSSSGYEITKTWRSKTGIKITEKSYM